MRGNENRDGWGIAFYPDESVQLIKEPKTAPESQLSKFLCNYPAMQSRIFLAHVRKASKGESSHRNTHPFSRELDGKDYVFAHNGTLRGHRDFETGRFQPLGETDSEYLFCYLLNCIAERQLSRWTDEEFEWLSGKLREINSFGDVNCLLADGELLFCYHDINGYRGLNNVHRQPPYGNIRLRDEDYVVNLSEEKNPDQTGYIVATQPLTDEAWSPFRRGELIVFKNGNIVFSSCWVN